VLARVDQLCGDAHAPAGLAYAALDDISDLQSLGYLTDVDGLALEGEGGVARQHVERGDLGQVGDDVLGDAVAEVFLLRIAAHVGEREDGDGWPRWQGGPAGHDPFSRSRHARDSVDPHRIGHVLQALLAESLEAESDLAADMIENGLRHEDAAR